jgi:hypothetical protein
LSASTQTLTYQQPDSDALTKESNGHLAVAKSYKIDSPETFALAADDLQSIKGRIKTLNEQRLTITRPLDAAKEAVMSLFRKPLETLAEAETVIKRAMLTYQNEEDRKAREEQARRQAEADAERRRVEAEAKRKQDEANLAEQNRLAAEAKMNDAIASGDSTAIAQAETVVEAARTTEAEVQAEVATLEVTAAVISAPIVADASPKAAGISTRENWKYEIVDVNLIPREYLMVDEKKIGQVVKALKKDTNIAGIRAYPESTLAARSK